MDITDQELLAFQDAYAIDLGDNITADEAREMLTRLVLFYERLAQPLAQHPEASRDSP